VLVLYSSFEGLRFSEEFSPAFLRTIRSDPSIHVDVYEEHIDFFRFESPTYMEVMLEVLRTKYADVGIDAIVPSWEPSLQLALLARERIFPGVPIIFGPLEARNAANLPKLPDATGAVGHLDVIDTVDLILQLRPDTKRVAVVAGSSKFEQLWIPPILADVATFGDRVETSDLTGLPLDELLSRASALPDHTVVLWGAYWQDPSGRKYLPAEVLALVHGATRAPIFGLLGQDLGYGIVGGKLVGWERSGEETAKLVLRVFAGEPAGSIPFADVQNPVMIDWGELERQRIDPAMVPADAVVVNREPTVWEKYGWYILGALGVIVAQSLLIAGLVAQRRRRQRAQQALAERLRFERLIADLSARFVDVAPDEIAAEIERGLAAVRDLFGVDRASLVRFGDGVTRVEHSVSAAGVVTLPAAIDTTAYADAVATLRDGGIIATSRVEQLPASLATSRETLERAGLRSLMAVPLQGDGEVLGALTLGTTREPREWDEEMEPRFRLLADLFASALVRQQTVEDLRRSEALGDAVLASLAAQVAVVDREGTIIAVNAAWERHGGAHAAVLARLEPGENYIDACREAAARGDQDAQRALAGVEPVLVGTASTFSMEYAVTSPTSEAWYQMTVEPLQRPEGGAVISHRTITARKRAELEAEHRRQELAHVTRVSTMGELAASLAHELNQPLTGVLTNAQVAMRLLAADPPDVQEVREILGDIVEDDKRAGEVIRRLRAMLQTGKIDSVPVNLNLAVAEVRRLVASDAVIRSATIDLTLAPDLPWVLGDRIQLQQVILNLAVNGMDAMKAVDHGERRLVVRTEPAGPETVRLAVTDHGTGIDHDKLGHIFQPFFSTKSEGLGMGLSIARTIVEAHGGTLAATNNPDRGATFTVTLPVAPNDAPHRQP
jgi:signal transduction histidine kinase